MGHDGVPVTSQELRRLLDAVVGVGLGLDLQSILRRVIEAAVDLAGATYGALGVLDATGTKLDDFITVGIDGHLRKLIGDLPTGKGVLGLLIDADRPLRLDDLRTHPASYGFPEHHPPMGSFLGVPIRVRGDLFGDLYLTEKRGGGSFTDADEELVVGLAAAAGVAIENARLHDRVGRLALAEDRERIGRDLHDTVIQRLFATGLSLQGSLGLCEADPAMAKERIGAAIDELDLTVKHIRTVIFGLEADRRSGDSLRDQVLALCRESAGALGSEPMVTFEGVVDTGVPDEVAVDLLATLREALANAARHSQANSVSVSLQASPREVRLQVIDDGVGPPDEVRAGGRGLDNMQTRAARWGGSSALDARRNGGSVLDWRVPVPPA